MKPRLLISIVIASMGVLAFALIGCEKNRSSSSSSTWTPDRANVSGFYTSDQGLGGWGGTIRLSAGYFVMKDPMLSSSSGNTMRGDYSVRGNTIIFYVDGSENFTAKVYKDRLVAGGRGIVYRKE